MVKVLTTSSGKTGGWIDCQVNLASLDALPWTCAVYRSARKCVETGPVSITSFVGNGKTINPPEEV